MAKDPKFVVHGSQVQKWTDDIQQLKQERDSFRKQRDELINDIADIKRKAEAFDEVKEYTLDKIETLTTRQEFAPNSNDFEYFGNLLTAFKAVKYKISDLERGSDEKI